jgi:uncharacterized protein YkwD
MNFLKRLLELFLSIFGSNNTPPVSPPPPPIPVPPESDPMEVIKRKLLEFHNVERAKRKVAPLVRNEKLDAAAQKHNDWMARNGKLKHSDVGDHITKEGYKWHSVGENIAMGYDTPERAMNGWMNSSGHRANILASRFKDVGFGVTVDQKGQWWWTADFGTE